MKEIRPKINEVELDLLVEAMEKAGYNARELLQKNSPLYQLYTRFRLLRKGGHVKLRVWRRPES